MLVYKIDSYHTDLFMGLVWFPHPSYSFLYVMVSSSIVYIYTIKISSCTHGIIIVNGKYAKRGMCT